MYAYVGAGSYGNEYWACSGRYPTIKDVKEVQVHISEFLGYKVVVTSFSYMGFGTETWATGKALTAKRSTANKKV